jgi:hypothetical protein
LLYSSCNIALSPVNFKSYLAKYFLDLKGKVKEAAILKAISILQELEISSLFLSLDTINSFFLIYSLFPFQKLNTLEGLLKYFFCLYIVPSKYSIQRYLKEQYSSLEVSNLPGSYIVIAKEQSLEPTRFFF